jgi:hypothetical protein
MFSRPAGVVAVGRALVICLSLATWPASLAHGQTVEAPGSAESLPDFVGFNDGELKAALERAVRGAVRRLERDTCLEVLREFSDSGGRRLDDVLSSLALTPPSSLSRVIFRDGRDTSTCRTAPTAAFTGAGSRVVFICGNTFARIDRSEAELIVIHELLHTLGLGERPPTSDQIDRAVARRCGR